MHYIASRHMSSWQRSVNSNLQNNHVTSGCRCLCLRFQPLPKPIICHRHTPAVGSSDIWIRSNGCTDDASQHNFAAEMELTVLFNWFSLKYNTQSLNELSHDLPEIAGKPHAKFGADSKETGRLLKTDKHTKFILLYLKWQRETILFWSLLRISFAD